MSDQEVDAIHAAYEHIKGLNRQQWTRALKYISERMAEDNRAAHSATETEAPTWFFTPTSPDERFRTPGDVAAEYGKTDCITEINGVAVVSQKFVILIPIGDGQGGIDGHEFEWFDDRGAAEKYLAEMTRDVNSGHDQ